MKDLIIKLKLDRSQATAANREYANDTRKMIEGIKAAYAGERAAILAGAKETAEGQKAIAAELAATEKQYRRQIAADSVQRGRDSARAIADAQREALKASMDLEKDATKQRLTAGQIAKQARDSMTEDENRQSVDKHKAALIRIKEFNLSSVNGFSMLKTAAGDAVKSVFTVANAYKALDATAQVVSAISQMWAAQRRDIEAAADALHRQREDALALAALKDNGGRSTQETADQLAFRAKTLQTASAANSFQEGALNTGQASIMAGFIDKDNFKKLMELGGSFQATNPKITPDAFGGLLGVLPSMIGKKDQTGEDVFRRSKGIMDTFQKGSSNPGPAVNQFQSNASLVGPGMFTSPEQMAAVQSAFSSVAPDSAGTLTRQFIRGTTGGLTKMRGSPFEGSQKQSEYLMGELQATDQMDSTEIGKLIAADMKKKEAEANKAGKQFNPMTFLTMNGYQDEESRMAVMQFSKIVNNGAYDKSFGPMGSPDAAPTIGDAQKPANIFQAVDPVAMGRRSQVAGDIASLTKAMGPEEFYLDLKKQAFAQLQADKTLPAGEFKDYNDSYLWRGPIVDKARSMMLEQGDKVGVPRPEGDAEGNPLVSRARRALGVGTSFGPLGGSPDEMTMRSEQSRAQSFYDYANQVKEKGGNTGDLTALLGLMTKSVDLQQKAEDRAIKGMNQAPAPDPIRQPQVGRVPGR